MSDNDPGTDPTGAEHAPQVYTNPVQDAEQGEQDNAERDDAEREQTGTAPSTAPSSAPSSKMVTTDKGKSPDPSGVDPQTKAR